MSDSDAPIERSPGDYPCAPCVAVGAIVMHRGRVLLVQRGKPPGRGFWAIPGGRVELGETLQAAAEREVAEETGIRIRARAPVFTFETIEHDSAGRVRFHYVVIDLDAEYLGGDLRPGSDARGARWVAPQDLATLEVSPVTRDLLQRRYAF